jgi:hypothetical protein
MQKFLTGLLLVLCVLTLAIACVCIVRADDKPDDKPPHLFIPPYQIPNFDGSKREIKAPVPAMAPATVVDGDEILRIVINCYPERAPWKLDFDLVAGARMSEGNTITTFDSSGISKYYVGVVAKMPLYNSGELDKERQQEFKRRGEIASNIQAFMKAIADRRRSQRELGLYTSLEARSQARVATGIAAAEEQVGYLEKVAGAQAGLDASRAAIEGARLSLVSQCRDEVANDVNEYLAEVAK